MNRATVYLVLAVLGAIIPVLFFLRFAMIEGISAAGFVLALFANGAAGGFTADLLISSFVFWIYMFSMQDNGPKPAAFILINCCIGLSCALPAYLWTLERRKTCRVGN